MVQDGPLERLSAAQGGDLPQPDNLRGRHWHGGSAQQFFAGIHDEGAVVTFDHVGAGVVNCRHQAHRKPGQQSADDGTMTKAVGHQIGRENSQQLPRLAKPQSSDECPGGRDERSGNAAIVPKRTLNGLKNIAITVGSLGTLIRRIWWLTMRTS
jgi:hypothetical protein